MSSIQVYVTAGSTAGRRLVLNEAIVRMGREPGNELIIDHPSVSRQQAELHLEDDGWYLHNQSTNGTWVRGKRVRGKPMKLTEGDVVSVGGQDIFTVTGMMLPGAEQPEGESQQAAKKPPVEPKVSKKAKIWIGIGIYMVVMLVGGVIIGQALRSENRAGDTAITELRSEEIRQIIIRPVKPLPVDPALEAEHLAAARTSYVQRHLSDQLIFSAYDNFRKSLAYGNKQRFDDPETQAQYLEVQDLLIDKVEAIYRRGYLSYRSRRFHDAVTEINTLMQLYPDSDSEIYRNAQRIRARSIQLRGRGRG